MYMYRCMHQCTERNEIQLKLDGDVSNEFPLPRFKWKSHMYYCCWAIFKKASGEGMLGMYVWLGNSTKII